MKYLRSRRLASCTSPTRRIFRVGKSRLLQEALDSSGTRSSTHYAASSSHRTPALAAYGKWQGAVVSRRRVISRALFDPPPFQPEKLAVLLAAGTTSLEPAPPLSRKYTLTHNDITGNLWLTIGSDYNKKQISGFYTRLLRDEVVAEWVNIGYSGFALHVYCHVSGEERWLAPPLLRNYIFRREMSLVLDTLVYADRELLTAQPTLAQAQVYVHFRSNVKELDTVECWGVLGDQSSWPKGPTSILLRMIYAVVGWPASLSSLPADLSIDLPSELRDLEAAVRQRQQQLSSQDEAQTPIEAGMQQRQEVADDEQQEQEEFLAVVDCGNVAVPSWRGEGGATPSWTRDLGLRRGEVASSRNEGEELPLLQQCEGGAVALDPVDSRRPAAAVISRSSTRSSGGCNGGGSGAAGACKTPQNDDDYGAASSSGNCNGNSSDCSGPGGSAGLNRLPPVTLGTSIGSRSRRASPDEGRDCSVDIGNAEATCLSGSGSNSCTCSGVVVVMNSGSGSISDGGGHQPSLSNGDGGSSSSPDCHPTASSSLAEGAWQVPASDPTPFPEAVSSPGCPSAVAESSLNKDAAATTAAGALDAAETESAPLLTLSAAEPPASSEPRRAGCMAPCSGEMGCTCGTEVLTRRDGWVAEVGFSESLEEASGTKSARDLGGWGDVQRRVGQAVTPAVAALDCGLELAVAARATAGRLLP